MSEKNVRRTKIIATLGPASDHKDVLTKMIEEGVNVVRLNFSHGPVDAHKERVQLVRKCAKKVGREVGILADLQGPKIRIARFVKDKVELKQGAKFILDADLDNNAGTQTCVGIDYKDLPKDVSPGDILLLDDGRLELTVERVDEKKIYTTVKVGGILSNNKGINRLGGGLSAKALTEKDEDDLKLAIELECDYIAVSFPRDAADMQEAKTLIKNANGNAGVIAKIERIEAIENLDEIIKASDGVMVARGDLGVEIGDAELPGVQKRIIQKARQFDKPVITATQMMESMIHNQIPTRAEVSDVANAVLDGTDAVMLSAETAVGEYPIQVVEAMSRICMGAERQSMTKTIRYGDNYQFSRIDEAIAMAAMYTAGHYKIKAIIALTESGATSLWMSRIRSGMPIYALTRQIKTQRKITLYRGVYPIHFDATRYTSEEINAQAIAELEKHRIVEKGDLVVLTKGDASGVPGGTNVMKILEVGAVV